MEKTILISLPVEDFQSLIIDCVNSCLKHQERPEEHSNEHLLSVEEASKFLMLSVATIYSKVSKGELPFMKRSKRLYFSSIDLMNYIKEGRIKTNSEIEDEAETYLLKTKKGLNHGK